MKLFTPVKGTSGNSICVMIARHFRAEGVSLCGINDRLSTKITQRGREKWISGGALKLSLCSLLLAISLPLMAMDLQEAMSSLSAAKMQGVVGEQPDGYLGAVTKSANADEIVKHINDARRAEYQRVAKENNIALPDVEAIAGQKAMEKTQSGQYIQVNKKWLKKH